MATARRRRQPANPSPPSRLPGRFRVPTGAGTWYARMGDPGRPGVLERMEYDNPVEVCQLPEIVARIVAPREIRYSLRWWDDEGREIPGTGQIISGRHLARSDAWTGPGVPHDVKSLCVLAAAIEYAAVFAPQIEGRVLWLEDRLHLPPDPHGPPGYGETLHEQPPAGVVVAELLELLEHNPKVALVAGAALGGIYLAPLRRDAFVIHLTGDSSEGKTTALGIAAAVLGNPEVVRGTWNKTSVGLTRQLGRLAVLPAIVDELGGGALTPPAIEALLYRVAEGASRTTATRTGTDVITSDTWRSVLISSGNRGLSNVTASPGLPARVVDVPTPICRDAPTAERLADLAEHLAGWPLRWTLEDSGLEHMRQLLERTTLQLSGSGVAGRAGKHLALCVAGAGRLGWLLSARDGAHRLGTAALGAALDVLADLEATLGEAGRLADQLLEAVGEAVASRPFAFPLRDDYEYAREQVRPVEGIRDEGRLLVLKKALEAIAAGAGMDDPKPALRELRDRGQLAGEGRLLRARTRLSGRVVSVYDFPEIGTNEDRARPCEPAARPPRDPARDPVRWDTPWSDAARDPRDPDLTHGRVIDALLEADEADKRAALEAAAEHTARLAETYERPALGAVRRERALAALAPRIAALPDDDERQLVAMLDNGEPLETITAALVAAESRPHQPPAPKPSRAIRGRTAARRKPLDLETRRQRFALAIAHMGHEARPEHIGPALARLEGAVRLTFEQPTPALAGLEWMHALSRVPLQPEAVDLPTVRYGFSLTNTAALFGFDPKQPLDFARYDVNASFPNAAQSLALGTGSPITIAAPALEDLVRRSTTLPGYVTVKNPCPDWPIPFRALEPGARLWTPLARLLLEQVPAAQLADAVIWPDCRRWLSAFARRMLDARAALVGDEVPVLIARAVLKAVYAADLGGMLASQTHNRTAYHRPDWAGMVKAAAAASMWRQLLALETPAAVVLAPDAAGFVCEPGTTPALVVSTQPGKWKLEHRAALTEQTRAAIEAGAPGSAIRPDRPVRRNRRRVRPSQP